MNAADCGFRPSAGDVGLDYGHAWEHTIIEAPGLWRSDIEHHRALTAASFSTAAYPTTAMRWLTSSHPESPVRKGRLRVSNREVDTVRTMTRSFHDLDNRGGGGRIRSTVVQYLDSNVAPLLRGTYTEQTGRQLFAAAAEITKNVGWMAYDAEQHGIAQRYLIQALRMARTAGDEGLGAEILAAMGQQAVYIGRPGDAVDLARVAQIAARKAGLPVLLAECHLLEAQGHAGLTDHRACAQSLLSGEKAFDRRESGTSPEWLSYFDEAYFAARTAHCFQALGDDARTVGYARRSLEMDENYVRGKAFNLAVLAGAHARTEPIEAARVGSQALELIEGLASVRALSYLRELRHRLRPHTALSEVADFLAHAGTVLTAG